VNPQERRQWAAEQAVMSFGEAGCDNDWNMSQRIGLFLELIEVGNVRAPVDQND
jgi:hypothetical protein